MERREAVEAAVADLPLMLSVEQARNVLGIGRSLAYGEVRRYLATDGRESIPAVRIGSAIRIPRAGLIDLILAAPAPTASELVMLHTVTPVRSQRQRRASSRSARSSRSDDVAQLPFAEPTGR